jgi:hypothetical protein
VRRLLVVGLVSLGAFALSILISVRIGRSLVLRLRGLRQSARAFPTGTGSDCTTALCGAGIVDAAATLAALASAPAPSGWTHIADEGQGFTVSGTQTVRYGNGSSWITMSVTTSGSCSNAFFGSDPIYGVVKECQVNATAPAPGWIRIADEAGLHGERHADSALRQRLELDRNERHRHRLVQQRFLRQRPDLRRGQALRSCQLMARPRQWRPFLRRRPRRSSQRARCSTPGTACSSQSARSRRRRYRPKSLPPGWPDPRHTQPASNASSSKSSVRLPQEAARE